MSSFLVALSALTILAAFVSPAAAASTHGASPKLDRAQCAAMLREAYQCKVEVSRLSHSRSSDAAVSPTELAVRENACEQSQERYVAFCRK